jgi:N-acetylneuraminic acid mutarotase
MTSPLSFKFHLGTTWKNPALRWIFGLAAFCVFLLVAVHPYLSASALSSPSPTITSISPTQAYNDQLTILTIRGTDFVPTPTVSLSSFPLSNVIFVNSSILTAQIPADLPEGVYSVVVTNPDSQSASLPNAFRVLASGDGSLSNWQDVTVMTTPRDWLAAVQAKNYLYILGGNNGNWGSWLTSVERATINTDGSLSSWQTTSPMNDARGVFAAVEANGYLYALGGYSYNVLSTVDRSFINPDGSLSAWQVTSSMNVARPALAAVSAYGYIYAIGGENTTTVERAKINSDGSLGPWEFTTSMNTPRGYLAAVVVGNYIYAIGGQGGGAASLKSVERTTINADGSLGAWESVTSMNKWRCDLAAVAVGGYIYALGGSTCTGVVYSSVEQAKVNADGTLSTWQILPSSLNIPRWHHAAAVRSPYIYVIGGMDEVNAALNSVEMAKIDKTVKIHLPFIIK